MPAFEPRWDVCRNLLNARNGSVTAGPQKHRRRFADPSQTRRRYCCIIGVTGAGAAVGCVLM
nr:MAG TPA: hypothetical protein [Caudoviricetes sp.]